VIKIDQAEFTLANWRVIPAEGTIILDDKIIRLEPKVMEVLAYLASRAGEVISREELDRDVWHGAIVGYDSVTSTIIKLRKALRDNAKNPLFIATVPKRGYQLIATVEYLDKNESDDSENIINKQLSAKLQQSTSSKMISVFIIGLLSLLIIAWISSIFFSSISGEDYIVRPSVMVLPFENLEKTDEHDNFVDGITEDLVTDLSGLSSLLVMASNTSFQYKGSNISPKDIGKELNVDFVLKGSIRRSGDSIRINTQLIDTKTGFNTWAKRYDKKAANFFIIQDEVVSSIVQALALKITRQEKQRLLQKTTMNLKAYDLFQEGQRISKISTKETSEQARALYRKAIEIDPTYGRAYGAIAYSLAFEFRRGWSITPVETLDRALALAEQAVALDNSIPQTYWSLGYVYLMRKEFNNASKAVEEAIRIAPNYADGYGLLALINNNLGHPKKAIGFIKEGMRLNPYYTWDYPYNLGCAYYLLGDYNAAIDALEKAEERNENAIPIKLYLATSYVKAKRQDDAEWAVDQLLTLSPTLTISHTNKTVPIVDAKFKRMFLEDLRQAGLPE